MPTWSDKLLQEVMRQMLEAYYEPQFSDRSHGFRPGRGCHSALREIYYHWRGTVWFIEGDIRGCFEHIDHAVLLSILREQILDQPLPPADREPAQGRISGGWRYHATPSGSPQGGVVSPILANIYLDRLDRVRRVGLFFRRTTEGTQRKAESGVQASCSDRAGYLRCIGRADEVA